MAGSPFHKSDEPAAIADVNVVPLADVSLVLLIILLVLSPMAAQSMLKVQTAAARAAAAMPTQAEVLTQREPEAAIAVAVSEAGFVMDGKLMTAVELTAYLKLKLQPRTDRKVFVAPELEASHGRVIEALEAVQAANGTVALVQIADPQAR